MPKRWIVIAVAAGVMALLFALGAGVAGAAKGGNSTNAKQCQKGGWANLATSDGSAFDSQDACVAYAAQGGVLEPKPVTHTLTVTVDINNPFSVLSVTANVSSDPAGIDACGGTVAPQSSESFVCTHDFAEGTPVTLTENPVSTTASFSGWSGACSGTATTCTVTMNSDVAVTAGFDQPQ